jgi:hypothetical protein
MFWHGSMNVPDFCPLSPKEKTEHHMICNVPLIVYSDYPDKLTSSLQPEQVPTDLDSFAAT